MQRLLKNFKDVFTTELLALHWRQWSALGVASQTEAEAYWWIDLEATIVSTLSLGLHDKRLLGAMIEWLSQNGEWVNLSRLKRIKNWFTQNQRSIKIPLIESGIYETMTRSINKVASSSKSLTTHEIPSTDFANFFKQFQSRGIVIEPEIRQPVLLQLLLRALFGVDAKVETFIYLFYHESGNSNSIAKEIFYDQKNIYRILEKWAKAGMIGKAGNKKTGGYFLTRTSEWLKVFGLKQKPGYLNWVRLFTVLDLIFKAITTEPWCKNIYLLSSLFRDIIDELRLFEKPLGISFPQPNLYPGEAYFKPFVDSLILLFEQTKFKELSQGEVLKVEE